MKEALVYMGVDIPAKSYLDAAISEGGAVES